MQLNIQKHFKRGQEPLDHNIKNIGFRMQHTMLIFLSYKGYEK